MKLKNKEMREWLNLQVQKEELEIALKSKYIGCISRGIFKDKIEKINNKIKVIEIKQQKEVKVKWK